MDCSDKPRRTMRDALKPGNLTDEAKAFLSGTPSKPTLPEPPSATEPPVEPTPPEPPVVEPPEITETTADPTGMALANPSVVVPGIVSMTFRLPANLSAQLARVSAERKLRRERPFSQQDIVAEALKHWLLRHGYGGSQRR